MPKRGEVIKIYRSDVEGYKKIDRLLSGNDAVDNGTKQPRKGAVQPYFTKPTVANDRVRRFMLACIDAGCNVPLKYTHAMEDGTVFTTHTDMRLLISAYLTAKEAMAKEFIMVDELLWDSMSEGFRYKHVTDGDLVIDGGAVYFIRRGNGIISSIASDMLK
jgi:hypothetical protein